MFKSLYKETEGFRLVSILTPLCMIGEVVMEMIIPKLMSSIIDDGVTAGNLSHIYRIGGWMIVAAAFGLLFGVLGGVFGARASTGYARNLRRSMYRNIQTFSFANIDKYSTAGLVTRMTTDVTNIQNAYQMILRMAIRAPSSMVIAMIMAFTINAKLASIYLVAVIILGGCLVLIMSRASNYFSAAFKKYDDLNESVQENVSAIRVVKAYVREDYESEKFKKASGNVQDLLLRAEKVLSFNSPLMMATVYTCILLISWLGARMIVLSGATSFTTGELMSMLTYCTNILTSLMMLSMVFIMISMSAASAKRVAEVLEEESTLSNGKNPVMEVKNGAVRFDHVCFRYKADGRDVLSDINLNIRSGETIGIIGGTGSAKPAWCSCCPACMIPPPVMCTLAAWMYAITTWRSCATALPWCCRKTNCSAAPLPKTCAGAIRMPPMPRSRRHASRPAPMNLLSASPINTTPTLTRAALTFPAARSSAFALPVLC